MEVKDTVVSVLAHVIAACAAWPMAAGGKIASDTTDNKYRFVYPSLSGMVRVEVYTFNPDSAYITIYSADFDGYASKLYRSEEGTLRLF